MPYPALNRLSHAISFCLSGFILVCIFTMDFIGPDLYTRSFQRDGLPVSYTEIHRNHVRLTLMAKGALVFGIAIAVMWLLWQFRAQANVRALGAQGLRFRPALSAATWLVPVANLVFPFFAVRELHRASDPDSGPLDWRRRRTFPLLWVWWLALLSALLLLFIAYRGLDPHPSFDWLMTRDRFVQGAAGVGLVASLLAIVIVESINARVFGKMEALSAGRWADWRRGA